MYGGYCFFNNAAIAAEAITRATGERVAILDVDYHHGNGTQQIFWRRGDVRYVSIHADPQRAYPYFLGRADETGEGEGAGENLNLPLRAGATNADYLEATDRALEAIAAAPGSVVVVSLGFDTYGLDPDRRLRAHDGRLPRGRPAGRHPRPPPRDPPGRRLPPSVARRERPGLAARRRRPAVRSTSGCRLRRRRVGRLIDLTRRGAVSRRRSPSSPPGTPISPAIVARYGPPPLWDRAPGFRDAAPHRARAAGVARVGAGGLRPARRRVRRLAHARPVPRVLRCRAARHRVQPPEGALRPRAGGGRRFGCDWTWTGSPSSTTTPCARELEAMPGHRAVDVDDLPADGARAARRVAGRRHRAGGVGGGGQGSGPPTRGRGDGGRSASSGARGAPSPRVCCGTTTSAVAAGPGSGAGAGARSRCAGRGARARAPDPAGCHRWWH